MEVRALLRREVKLTPYGFDEIVMQNVGKWNALYTSGADIRDLIYEDIAHQDIKDEEGGQPTQLQELADAVFEMWKGAKT